VLTDSSGIFRAIDLCLLKQFRFISKKSLYVVVVWRGQTNPLDEMASPNYISEKKKRASIRSRKSLDLKWTTSTTKFQSLDYTLGHLYYDL
jgi:hypothetical protein